MTSKNLEAKKRPGVFFGIKLVSFFSLAAANEALQVHTQRACPEPPDNVRMHASTVLQQRRVVGNMRRVRGHPAPGLTDQPPSVARLARGATGQVAASLPDSTNFYLRKFRCFKQLIAWPGQRVRWPWLTMHEAHFHFLQSSLCTTRAPVIQNHTIIAKRAA